ncbi:MAG TPA: FxsA family protein, partial [Microthrixaceae bacterium]|nr:FxsA family protein [Microthrixaceae bacterium]HNO44257.1 FxsA family protein [Microthrixaceae bacterium]
PTDTLLDGLMVLVGGVLLIVPGFLTAVPGLLLLFPPTRALLRPVMTRWVERRAARSAVILTSFGGPGGPGGAGFGSFRIDAPFGRGPVVDADSHERRPSTAYAEVVEVDVDAPREIGPPT